MKAAVLRAVDQDLEIEDVQVDRPGPREVLIRTGATGVCHGDLHRVEGRNPAPMPTVLGHEASGTVEAAGEQVTYVNPGDRVVTCTSVFCGHCRWCVTGRPVLCSRAGLLRSPSEPPRLRQGRSEVYQFLNVSSFAEKMLVHENSVVKVGDDLPFAQLALVGCSVLTGVGAVLNRARPEPGSTVAVLGCGGIGLNVVQGAVLAGAGRVIAIDTVGAKLELARDFGATDAVDASAGDVVARVKEMTDGGVDYSFEAIGTRDTVRLAFEMLAPGGTATVIGLVPQGTNIEVDGASLLAERTLQGSRAGSNRFRVDMPRYLEFYRQGRLKLDELVSRRLRLEQVNQALEALKGGEAVRSVIVLDG